MKKSKLLMPLTGIAALGAITPVIMTATSCGKTTSDVSTDDTAYLEKVNNYLSLKSGLVSPHKAVEVLKDLGYDVQNYHLSNSNCQFAYDASAKRFIIMKGDDVVASPKDYTITNNQSIFKFTSVYDKDSKFGQYLVDDYELPTGTTTLEVKTSLDVGNNQNISKIKYIGDEDASKYILLRTFSQSVTINAEKNTVFHMGIANNLTVTASDSKPNFYEVGKVAYMKSTNIKLNLVVLNGAEGAQIDILEPVNTTKGSKFEESSLTAYTAYFSGILQPTEATFASIIPVTQQSELVGSTAGIYRLSNDIKISASAIEVSKTVVLDLNGKTITSDLAAGSAAIKVVGGGTLEIIDSSVGNKGTISFTEQYITVTGDSANNSTAALWLEGGNYDFTGTANHRSGFIQIGEAASTTSQIQCSCFYMNGGKITTQLANGVESCHDNQANGIYLAFSSYVQITYGTIQSSEVCMRGTGSNAGHDCYIDIYGGTFKQTSSAYGECIFQPQGGDLNIYGGTFEGRSCIATKNSSVNISGGYFHATGKHEDLEPTTTTQEQDTDGSVLCMELTAKSYGVNPSITVHNATLYSENSYILQIYGQPRETGAHLAEADFFGGVFWYATDASIEGETTLYTGVRIAAAVESDVRVNQYGGSWVRS